MKEVCRRIGQKLEVDAVDLFVLTHELGREFVIGRVDRKIKDGGVPSERDLRYLSRPGFPKGTAAIVITLARDDRMGNTDLYRHQTPEEVSEWDEKIEEIIRRLK